MSRRSLFLCFSLFLILPAALGAGTDPLPSAVEITTAPAIGESVPPPYYDGRKEGWYWYETDPEIPREEEDRKRDRNPRIEDYTYEQLWEMYPDDFDALQTRFLKQAVRDPSPKNVHAYMQLQDMARKKALAFTNVQTMLAQLHPELTTSAHYPVTPPGQTALMGMRMNEEDETIGKHRDMFALIFFTQEDCGFCGAQEQILSYFVDKYGWPVREIDIGARPDLAARFGVTITPSLLLVEKTSGEYLPVAAGVVSMADLVNRLVRTIRYMSGERSPQEWFLYNFEKEKSDAAQNKK